MLKNDKIRRILWVKPSIGEEINDARKNLDKAIEKVLVSEEEIIEKSKELGEILTKEYEGKIH